jgi:site-specific recombinase XerC
LAAGESAKASVIAALPVNPALRRVQLLSSIRRLIKRRVKQKIGRQISPKRQESLEKTLTRGAERIWALGYHIDDVAKLDARHVQALLQALENEGFREGTLTSYLTAFRQLGRWLANAQMANLKR